MTILQGEIGFEIDLQSLQNLDSFALNTPGGDLFEGLAMYDYVKSKSMEVGVIGVCASAGTLPLIASENRWGTPNSRYLIHNPWAMMIGEAKDLQKAANSMKAEEVATVDLYEKHLLISRDEIIELMAQDKMIHAKEALRIGLIKEIREFGESSNTAEGSDLKSLYIKFKMQYMKKEDKEKENVNVLKSLISEFSVLMSSLRKVFKPKNIVLQDVNGVSLDFGDEVETKEAIEVGSKVTANGESTTDNYTMPDGTVYVIEVGTVTEIKEPEANETEALKEENEQLKADLEVSNENATDLQSKLNARDSVILKMQAEFEKVNLEFEKIKKLAAGEKPEDNMPATMMASKKVDRIGNKKAIK